MDEKTVSDIIGQMQPKQNMFDIEAKDLWLSDMGVLTEDFLAKAVQRILILLDKGIRTVEISYNQTKGTVKILVGLTKWSYYFRKNKVLQKLTIFSEVSLPKFEVFVKFTKYNKTKKVYVDDTERRPEKFRARATPAE
jgi:hypothetical protein